MHCAYVNPGKRPAAKIAVEQAKVFFRLFAKTVYISPYKTVNKSNFWYQIVNFVFVKFLRYAICSVGTITRSHWMRPRIFCSSCARTGSSRGTFFFFKFQQTKSEFANVFDFNRAFCKRFRKLFCRCKKKQRWEHSVPVCLQAAHERTRRKVGRAPVPHNPVTTSFRRAPLIRPEP